MRKPRPKEEKIIKDMKNLSRLKKERPEEEKVIKRIRNFLD